MSDTPEQPQRFKDQPDEGGRETIDRELARRSAGEGKAPADPPAPDDPEREKAAIERTAGQP